MTTYMNFRNSAKERQDTNKDKYKMQYMQIKIHFYKNINKMIFIKENRMIV